MRTRPASVLLAATLLLGCNASGPILANPPVSRPSLPPPRPAPSQPADPLPVVLPRDDGPHERLMEWWYYTGHLFANAPTRRKFGYEFVIFRGERGSFPTIWASHLAVTDEMGKRFLYAQRAEVGDAVDQSPRDPDGTPTGFDLRITGSDPTDPTTLDRLPWSMTGSDGVDHLTTAMSPAEATAQNSPRLGLDLGLGSVKPPALHDGDGWIDFGPVGSSYYYSRTSMATIGRLTLGDATLVVGGLSWFDHQWGDFISIGGGGWDWFAINLDDGTDLTLSLVRDADGSYPLVYGTLVGPSASTRHLGPDEFSVETTAHWHSPTTAVDYPAGWSIHIPAEKLTIDLTPTVADQELDTQATTGVVYWEGSQNVSARRGPGRGVALGGQAYVELTGYAPSGTTGTAP